MEHGNMQDYIQKFPDSNRYYLVRHGVIYVPGISTYTKPVSAGSRGR
jgi:hypothetical protein